MAAPQWPFKLYDLFRVTLDPKPPMPGVAAEYERWQEEISRGFENLRDEDICRAIQVAADDPKTTKYKPTAREIRKWVKLMWWKDKQARLGREKQFEIDEAVEYRLTDPDNPEIINTHQTTMSDLRADINTAAIARDWDKVWEVICLPASSERCEQLEDYAMIRWKFTRDLVSPEQRTIDLISYLPDWTPSKAPEAPVPSAEDLAVDEAERQAIRDDGKVEAGSWVD